MTVGEGRAEVGRAVGMVVDDVDKIIMVLKVITNEIIRNTFISVFHLQKIMSTWPRNNN